MKEHVFLDLAMANAPIMEELKDAACQVIASGRYLHGEQTALLEQEMAMLCQVKYCIAVSNGLDALRLVIRAYKEMGVLHEGDKVIVPGNTYVASLLAVSDNGLEPCPCDVREDTMNLDTCKIEPLLTPQVKAVMPVHLYGTPCWDEQLIDIAKRYNLKIIEDNAQAVAAQASVAGLNGTKVTGGLGHATGMSFYPTKNLGALGDAGCVLTSDEQLASTVRALANYGADRRYHNIYKGLNCRIDEIQAAMLRVKLKHLGQETQRRMMIARTYNEHITNPLVTRPAIFDDMQQVWHQYVVRVKERDRFMSYLKQNGVGTDIHYATPPHRQPCYSELASCKLPVAEMLAREVVSLPIAYPISQQDAIKISNIINDFKAK